MVIFHCYVSSPEGIPYFGEMTSHLPKKMVLFTRAKGTRIATRVSEGLGEKGSVPENTSLNHTVELGTEQADA